MVEFVPKKVELLLLTLSEPSLTLTATDSKLFLPSSSISPTDIEILLIAFVPMPRALRKALERAFVWFAL